MRITIENQSFAYIEVYRTSYIFERNNSGPVVCRDCKREIGSGLGIHRQSYRRNGYICFVCFARDVEIITKTPLGDPGFFVDSLGRLRACCFNRPDHSTPRVIEAVYKALLDQAYTSIDILLGEESAHPWKISDAAESAIGS